MVMVALQPAGLTHSQLQPSGFKYPNKQYIPQAIARVPDMETLYVYMGTLDPMGKACTEVACQAGAVGSWKPLAGASLRSPFYAEAAVLRVGGLQREVVDPTNTYSLQSGALGTHSRLKCR